MTTTKNQLVYWSFVLIHQLYHVEQFFFLAEHAYVKSLKLTTVTKLI